MDMGVHQNTLHNSQVEINDGMIITPIDLDSVQEHPESIKQLVLSKNAKFSEYSDREIMDYLNRLYIKAIDYLREELFYEKHDIGKLPAYRFKNWDDVISFIEDTKKIKGKTKCTILKYMLAIDDASDEFNERIGQIREKTQRVLENKLKGPLQILEENEDGDIRGVVSLQGEVVEFILRKREKSNNSNVSKEIRDPKYSSIESFSDQYGVTFSNLKEETIPLLMEYITQIVFKKGIYDIKNQGVITESSILDDEYISENFKEKLFDSLESIKKDETAKNYRVIKIVTPLYKDDQTNNLSIEIKFEPKQSRNETGVQMQGVYAYFKKIAERVRTEQYIKPEYIELVVSKFIENLQDILDKNINKEDKNLHRYKVELFNSLKRLKHIPKSYKLTNKHTKSHLDDLLLMGLTSYYKSKLRTVQINAKGKTYYTNSRNIEISELGIWKNVLTSDV